MDDSLSLGNAFRNLIQRVDLLAFCLDKQKRVTFCNEYLLKLTGYSREEVIGSNWFEKFCPAEVRDELAERCAQYADDGRMPRQLIMEVQTATGERLQISCYGTTLSDESGEIVGTAGIAENVTDRLAIKRDLMASQKRLCELSAELSLGQLARTAGDKPADGCRQVHLSAREREIFKWVKDGKTYWEISQILGISERTVKFLVKNVMRKLGVSSRIQAIASVLSQGLLDLA